MPRSRSLGEVFGACEHLVQVTIGMEGTAMRACEVGVQDVGVRQVLGDTQPSCEVAGMFLVGEPEIGVRFRDVAYEVGVAPSGLYEATLTVR